MIDLVTFCIHVQHLKKPYTICKLEITWLFKNPNYRIATLPKKQHITNCPHHKILKNKKGNFVRCTHTFAYELQNLIMV